MKHLNRYLAALLVGGSLVGATLVAQAKTDNSEDVTAVTNAAVTLDLAVAIATQTVPGTASKAEFENEDGQLLWEVEVVDVNGQVYDLIIDANSGKVLEQELDEADEDEDEDDKD